MSAVAALVASITVLLMGSTSAGAVPATIVVSGDTVTSNGSGRWVWGGADYDQLQGLLTTESFGEATFSIDADGMDPADLTSAVQVFVGGAVDYTPTQTAALLAWIQQGGVYIANAHHPDLDNFSFLPGTPALNPVSQWEPAVAPDPNTHACSQNVPAGTCEAGDWSEFSAPVTATVAAPSSPVIAGPFGTAANVRPWHTVTTFATLPTGAQTVLNFTNTCTAGPPACSGTGSIGAYDNNQSGPLVAVVPFGTAGYGSGTAIVMSDGDLFSNAYGATTNSYPCAGCTDDPLIGSQMIAGNRALALNTFAWIGDHFTAGTTPPPGGGGTFPPGQCRAATNPPSNPDPASAAGYWFLGRDGGVFAFGDVGFLDSLPGRGINATAVAMAANSAGTGYWVVDTAGNVYAFGAAATHGDMRSTRLNAPIIGIEATPSGNGYWLLASDGGVFAFGDAVFHGSTGAMRLNQPIIGMRATTSGDGYWLLAADGGVFSYGDAEFKGSTGNLRLNAPVISMAVDPNGGGYWLLGQDGGVFSFGVQFQGSVPGLGLCANPTAVQIRATGTGEGYYLLGTDGGVFSFGDAAFKGSLPGINVTPNQPLIDMVVQF